MSLHQSCRRGRSRRCPARGGVVRFELLEPRALLTGEADVAFGGNGEITLDLAEKAVITGAGWRPVLAAGPTGHDLIAARMVYRGSSGARIAVARLGRTGELDRTFGAGGVRVVTGGDVSSDQSPRAVAVQADGRIVIAGSVDRFSASGTVQQVGVWRLAANGDSDPAFGSGGPVTVSLPFRTYVDITAVAVQADGAIIVAGTAFDAGYDADYFVLRVTATGQIDTAFGAEGSGIVFVPFDLVPLGYDAASTLLVQPDGSILVGGTAAAQTGNVFGLARLTSTGRFDPTFGTGGRVVVGSQASSLAALLSVGDGVFVVGGYEGDTGDHMDGDVQIHKLLADGTPDASFGVNGMQMVDIADSNDRPLAGQVGVDGSVVLLVDSGYGSWSGTPSGTVLLKLLANGQRDPGFGTAGVTWHDRQSPTGGFSYEEEFLAAAAFKRDGSVAVATPSFDTKLTIRQYLSRPVISPVLIVSAHGQEVDAGPIARSALAAMLGLLGPLATFAAAGVDGFTGGLTGSGRGPDPWQVPLGSTVYDLLRPSMGDQAVAVKSLVVNWDSYGTVGEAAREVADEIGRIVADTSNAGLPWDILLVGFSRGGIFIDEVLARLGAATNPQIDYVQAVYLDATASKISGDNFPAAVPAGVDRAIVYDDGYAFPLTQPGLSFKIFGQPFSFPITEDGNNSSPPRGAEYRYVRSIVTEFAAAGSSPDFLGSLKTHSAMPYWWLNGSLPDSTTTPVVADVEQFLAQKDGGRRGAPGSQLLALETREIRPSTTVPTAQQLYDQLVDAMFRFARRIIEEALRLGEIIVLAIRDAAIRAVEFAQDQARRLQSAILAERDRFLKDVAAQAPALVSKAAAALKQADKAIARKVAALASSAKAAEQRVNKLLASADKKLDAVKAAGEKAVVTAQRKVDRALTDVAGKTGRARERAEAAARKAAADLEAKRAAALRKAERAAANLAAQRRVAEEALVKARDAAAAAATRATDGYKSAVTKVAKKFKVKL